MRVATPLSKLVQRGNAARVRERRRRSREVLVPLAHDPGHAQVDFGEASAVIAGVERKVNFPAMDLPHSYVCFVKSYPAETSEAFRDGHNAAFASFGSVPNCTRKLVTADLPTRTVVRGAKDLQRVMPPCIARTRIFKVPKTGRKIFHRRLQLLPNGANPWNRFALNLQYPISSLTAWADRSFKCDSPRRSGDKRIRSVTVLESPGFRDYHDRVSRRFSNKFRRSIVVIEFLLGLMRC